MSRRRGILIGFAGSPYSGKTTTAALLFGELKKRGVQVEYLPEYARERIRELKALNLIHLLDDEAQITIRDRQAESEDKHLEHNGDGAVTITDGSTVNSFFYGGSGDAGVEAARYDLLFFSENIESRSAIDANRVHDVEFSRDMEKRIESTLKLLCPVIRDRVRRLEGDIDDRLSTAMAAVTVLLQRSRADIEANNG
jgi:hypothetical protein